jgi:hypothetical protein
MTPATKKEAFAKLEAITNRIGYPDKWRDYASVRIERDDFAGNWQRATEFEVQHDLHKIGRPVDRAEWPFSTATVNAGYEPTENSINFPAGILQPPAAMKHLDEIGIEAPALFTGPDSIQLGEGMLISVNSRQSQLPRTPLHDRRGSVSCLQT